MSRNKRPDYVADTFYRRNMSQYNAGFMPNVSASKLAIYERFYFKRLVELATNRFKWEGLPTSIDARFLEMTLLNNGLAVVFEDFTGALSSPDRAGKPALFAMRGAGVGNWNMFDNPTKFQIYGQGYPTRTLPAKKVVPIWNNYTRTPDIDLVQIYAYRLANLDVTIDINAHNARRTRVAFADENQRLGVANINRLIDEGNPVVYTRNPLGMSMETADFGVDPKGIEALHILKVRLWNEAMMMLGINGANQDKKERLVSDEVEANDEQISLNRATALNSRLIACEQIGRKFELPLTVDFVTQNTAIDPIVGV